MSTRPEMGSFLPLEISQNGEYHRKLLAINSGRNALRLAIRTLQIQKLLLPRYICDSVIKAAEAENTQISFYNIDSSFMPCISQSLSDGEYILYADYFGLHQLDVSLVIKHYGNTIIDNVQAFYAPVAGTATIYSCRKFFGVPDGGYLYMDKLPTLPSKDKSYEYCDFLLKKADGLENISCRVTYILNEQRIDYMPVAGMSNLTSKLMSGIDYEFVSRRRRENFKYLHSLLKHHNEFSQLEIRDEVPMIYPFFCHKNNLREYLIDNNIYVAQYWSEVLDRAEDKSFESELVKYVVPLPVDQRYDYNNMDYLAEVIINFERL